MKKVISPDGRRPKKPEEKEQDARNAQQAVKDLYQLREHYGSWASIIRKSGVPKSTLEGIYKGKKKVVGAATMAWIKAALQVIHLEKTNSLIAQTVHGQAEIIEQLKRKIDKLSIPEG